MEVKTGVQYIIVKEYYASLIVPYMHVLSLLCNRGVILHLSSILHKIHYPAVVHDRATYKGSATRF